MPALPALVLLLAAAPGCGLPDTGAPRPFAPGERLDFAVRLGGMNAGVLSTRVGTGPVPGGVEVSLEARQTGLGSGHFRARSTLSASLRPGAFRDEQEGFGGRRTTEARIDRSPNAVRIDWTQGGRPRMNAYLRGPDVLDFASAVPYLRAADLRPGTPFCFEAVGATRYWRIEGRVAERPELVPTPGGGQEALRLEATMRRADGGGRPVPLRLWITTGPGRLPVAAEAGTPLGRVRVELMSAVAGSGPYP